MCGLWGWAAVAIASAPDSANPAAPPKAAGAAPAKPPAGAPAAKPAAAPAHAKTPPGSPGGAAGSLPPGHPGVSTNAPQTGPTVHRASLKIVPAPGNLKLRAVTLQISQLRKEFRVGDTDYTATILDFVPDFAMDIKADRVFSRTAEPNNPAWRIVVRRHGTPEDTTWAFLNLPPHFARKSLLAFLATQATFENHAPVVSKDSLAIRLDAMGAR
jgi:hypothetical protein